MAAAGASAAVDSSLEQAVRQAIDDGLHGNGERPAAAAGGAAVSAELAAATRRVIQTTRARKKRKIAARKSAPGATAVARSDATDASIFEPAVVERRLKQVVPRMGAQVKATDGQASVYMAAVMEYLTAEMVEAAGDAARDSRDNEIDAKHIQAGISADDELAEVKDSCKLYANWKRKRRKRPTAARRPCSTVSGADAAPAEDGGCTRDKSDGPETDKHAKSDDEKVRSKLGDESEDGRSTRTETELARGNAKQSLVHAERLTKTAVRLATGNQSGSVNSQPDIQRESCKVTAKQNQKQEDDDGSTQKSFEPAGPAAVAGRDAPPLSVGVFDPSVVGQRLSERMHSYLKNVPPQASCDAPTARTTGVHTGSNSADSVTDGEAPIYMAAVMEYLTGEMLGAAAHAAAAEQMQLAQQHQQTPVEANTCSSPSKTKVKIDAKHIEVGMSKEGIKPELNQVKDSCGLYASWKRKQQHHHQQQQHQHQHQHQQQQHQQQQQYQQQQHQHQQHQQQHQQTPTTGASADHAVEPAPT